MTDEEAMEKATGLEPKQVKRIMDDFYKPQIAMAHAAGRKEAFEEVWEEWASYPEGFDIYLFTRWLRTQQDKDGEK